MLPGIRNSASSSPHRCIVIGSGIVLLSQGFWYVGYRRFAQSGNRRVVCPGDWLQRDVSCSRQFCARLGCFVAWLRIGPEARLRATRSFRQSPRLHRTCECAVTLETNAATWGIATLATLGVVARPWNLPEFIWAIAGAALLVVFNLLPWPEALAAAGKGTDVY